MESGTIVEYIDSKKIICGMVLESKNQRLRILNESNREVKLSANRIAHKSKTCLNTSLNRDRNIEALKETASRRKELMAQVNVKELWEVLFEEQEWIDLETMTAFCFPNNPSDDHESAVIRAFFDDRIYFKFDNDKFFPNSADQVEQILSQLEEAAKQETFLDENSKWLKMALHMGNPNLSDDKCELIDMLKSYYLLEKESPHYEIIRQLLSRSGLDSSERVLDLLVTLNVWTADENIDLYRYDIPIVFPQNVAENSQQLTVLTKAYSLGNHRKDLTSLPLITIDGQSTLDFDDALSIEKEKDYYRVGIHITDVAHVIQRASAIDKEARVRGSSIYMPDQRIPMLPSDLSEDFCSLKAGETRPAISVMAKVNDLAEVFDFEIVPSIVRVQKQLSYFDADMRIEHDEELLILQKIAKNYRDQRLSQGAINISIPEMNIWFNEKQEIMVSKINREGPSRMLVSELMILANSLMADFLANHGVPAVYRSQPMPKDRLYKTEGTLFQNWMQRKLLSRFVLGNMPERHHGLGVDAYVTATSPIRRYFDLITQRQIRAILGFETAYSSDEINRLIQELEQPVSIVNRIQNQRRRYWLLKYLEDKSGTRHQAIVLHRRRNDYAALLTDYMFECSIPMPGYNLRPEDVIQITIQHVNARKDILTVFMN